MGVPSRGSLRPGPEPYHELGVAILEGAPRVPVALLLAIHHAALHSVLDLRSRAEAVDGQPAPRDRDGRKGRLSPSRAAFQRGAALPPGRTRAHVPWGRACSVGGGAPKSTGSSASWKRDSGSGQPCQQPALGPSLSSDL